MQAFNEAEAVAAMTEYNEEDPVKPILRKSEGKRASLIQNLPIVPVSHMINLHATVSVPFI